MQTSNLAHFFDAPKSSASKRQFTQLKQWTTKVPGLSWLYGLSLAIATAGLGITANPGGAQVVYFERPVSVSVESGVVSTNSGIGLNVRSGPGLRFPVIGGADDGNFLRLVGAPVSADGYTWQRVSTGGWVASEYVNGNGVVNVSFNNGCLRQISACGGDSEPIARPQPPILRPISVAGGGYTVAVPGSDARTVMQVRQFVPGAFVDSAREGRFVNAGGFSDYEAAKSMSYLLRSNGMDARVIYK